jgi:alpha-glucosidase
VTTGDGDRPAGDAWWRTAVVYQLYIRSFADGGGDGVGDIAGIRRRLPYLAGLGIDAVWITPWYPSPMADAGYDVADYHDVDPAFGTLAEARALLDEAHAAGLRLILDLVPNHTSDRHPWFRAALAAGPGSSERERYLFRDGRDSGRRPPNDWRSVFGGPAWTRVTEAEGRPGQWYLHLFAPEQPDLNWADPRVRAAFESTLRFWFDLGVDGFRVDVAHGLAKAPGLPDLGYDEHDGGRSGLLLAEDVDDHPHWDVDAVLDIYRSWRAIADDYGGRTFVAEAVVGAPHRVARYVRPDTLHTAFNFAFLKCPWDADALRAVIDETVDALGAVGAPATWVLSSHDETRLVTRYGRADTAARDASQERAEPTDLELGTRRARAAALLMLALPGGAYVYQGEELGLWQVEDLPFEVLQDPMVARSGGEVRGRDGCRVPLPWEGEKPPFGFCPDGCRPWLPQPAQWRALTVTSQDADPGSTLALYRRALALRRSQPGLAGEAFRWLASPESVLFFERGPGVCCAVNLGERPWTPPAGARVLLSSAPLDGEAIPGDAAAWLAVSPSP